MKNSIPKVVAYYSNYPLVVEIFEVENDYVKFRSGFCFSDAENSIENSPIETAEILFKLKEDAGDFSEDSWISYFLTSDGTEVDLNLCLRTNFGGC